MVVAGRDGIEIIERPVETVLNRQSSSDDGNFCAAASVSPWQSTREALVSDQTDLIQGTLDLLIMRTIALEPMHG